MENPFSTVDSLDGSEGGGSKASNPTYGSTVYPKRVKSLGGCIYERLGFPESNENVVYVPFGAAHAQAKFGWRAEFDPQEGKLFFVRLSDATERTWRLPDVSKTAIQEYGALHSKTRDRKWLVGEENNTNEVDGEADSEHERGTEDMPIVGRHPFVSSLNADVYSFSAEPYDSGNRTANKNAKNQTNVLLGSFAADKARVDKKETVSKDDAEADVFLSNTRLSSFDESLMDDAVTPLEKLLRESATETTAPCNAIVESEKPYDGFTSIYQPSVSSDAERVAHERPPVRLLVAQRHQLEMERRLAQRERDKIERALDERNKEIRIPADAHAQLKYEPSPGFAQERQAILGALAAMGPPPAEAMTPGPRPATADVSPISPRSFVQSPTPAKAPPRGWQEALVAEAYEYKTAAGRAGLQRAVELHQRFVAGMPRARPVKKSPVREDPPTPPPPIAPPDASSDVVAATYVRRLARIQELYSTGTVRTGARADAVFYHRRPLATPLLPPSLEPLDHSLRATEGTSWAPHADPHLQWHRVGAAPAGERSAAIRTPAAAAVSKGPARHRRIMTPPLPAQGAGTSWDRSADASNIVSKPVLCWDVQRSGNVLVSQKGTTCLAYASRALQLIAEDARQTGQRAPNVMIPMFALGTVGVSTGEFIFEVRVDAHPSSTKANPGEFAVGVATKYYHNAHARSPAYLYRSNGTIVADADDHVGVPYGRPYQSGSHITVHLDLNKRQQSFFLNGKPLGVAFRFRDVEDPEPLFPLVLLGCEGDTASFVPPSPPQLPAHLRPPR